MLLAVVTHLLVAHSRFWSGRILPFVKAMAAQQQQALEEQERQQARRSARPRAVRLHRAEGRSARRKSRRKPPDLSDRTAARRRSSGRRTRRTICRSRAATLRERVGRVPRARSRQEQPIAPARGESNADSRLRQPNPDALTLPDSPTRARIPNNGRCPDTAATGRRPASSRDAIRNVQRYVAERVRCRTSRGNGDFGPSIQFDTKGVEFGPWLRRFIAQIKRNWFVPYAAMSLRGHVVLTFNVHRDGTHHRAAESCGRRRSTRSPTSAFNAIQAVEPDRCRCRPSIPDENASVHRHVLLQRIAALAVTGPTRTQQVGLFLVLTRSRCTRSPASCGPLIRLRSRSHGSLPQVSILDERACNSAS